MLTLASHLRLPIHVVTESIAILAKRRAGKSTTARRITEQLHKAKQQVVVVDPKGDWWGLLFARDGKSPGLPFVVLSGEHGHIKLEAGSGELVARLVVTERVRLVLDLSEFRKHEVSSFMTAFMEHLYRLKAREEYRTPMMLMIDEADGIAPQKPQSGEERMLGAAEDLVRRGGQRGIGVTMLTQRSAVLNKNVLTQIGILIVLRTIAPQDLAAMDAWIDVHGTLDQRKALIESLPSLDVGTGWVWAPGWPDAKGIFSKHAFLLPETFDSSKTPGQSKTVVAKNAADVDLDAFKREMASTIQKANEENPAIRRSRMAKLKAEVHSINVALERERQQKPAGREKRVEVPVIKDAQIARVEKLVERFDNMLSGAMRQHASVCEQLQQLVSGVHAVRPAQQTPTPKPESRASTPSSHVPGVKPAPVRRMVAPSNSDGDATIGHSGLRRMLIALAQRNGLTRRQLGVRAGLSSRSGTFDTYLSRGRSNGWIAPRIPISSRLRTILEMRRFDPNGDPLPLDAYVFGNAIGQKVDSTKRAWLTAVLKAHGYKPTLMKKTLNLTPECRAALAEIDLHVHDLRREAGSRWLEGGVQLHVIRDWLGHTSIAQTSTYLAGTMRTQHDAMAAFEARRASLQPFATDAGSGGRKAQQTAATQDETTNKTAVGHEPAIM